MTEAPKNKNFFAKFMKPKFLKPKKGSKTKKNAGEADLDSSAASSTMNSSVSSGLDASGSLHNRTAKRSQGPFSHSLLEQLYEKKPTGSIGAMNDSADINLMMNPTSKKSTIGAMNDSADITTWFN